MSDQPLASFTGTAVYLDTMIPYALLRGLEPKVQTLFHQIQSGAIQAFTSALTFDELTYRLLLALIRDAYDGSPLDHLRREGPQLIGQFYPRLEPALAQLRRFPHLTVLDVTLTDLEGMAQAIQRYHLKPRDALHLAAMERCNCFDLVSQDDDFDRAPMVRRYTLG